MLGAIISGYTPNIELKVSRKGVTSAPFCAVEAELEMAPLRNGSIKRCCAQACATIPLDLQRRFGRYLMTDIEKLAQLKQLLFSLEKDLGIEDLGQVKRNILYAATLVSIENTPIETDSIRSHELVAQVARSTFFKAIKELVDANYLRHVGGAQRSHYLLTEKAKGN